MIKREQGFTLIELLVVCVIFGLLAAIAVPAFLNQRTKAQDAEAKATAATAQVAIEAYGLGDDRYDGATVADLNAIEPTLPDGAPLSVASTQGTYTVTVTSDSGTDFSIERQAGGGMIFACAVADSGGCGSGGLWN